MKLGKGSCHGTFGELVQGIIGERPFLITLPIPSLRSEAIFIPDPAISEIRVVNGQLMERFGVLPPFILVGMDLGGTVKTIEYNQVPKVYSRDDHKHFLEAYDWVKKGFRENNLAYICKAATISARVNQKILPKADFHKLEKLAHTCQGGTVVAHSGTVAGILIDRNIPNCHEVVSQLLREMSIPFKSMNINLFHYDSEEKNISLMI